MSEYYMVSAKCKNRLTVDKNVLTTSAPSLLLSPRTKPCLISESVISFSVNFDC